MVFLEKSVSKTVFNSRCELLSETADSDKNPVSLGKEEDLFNFRPEKLTTILDFQAFIEIKLTAGWTIEV